MTTPQESTWEDYSAAVSRFIASLDTVLAHGDRAQQRMAEFYRCHGIEPGSGEAALTAPTLPPAEREANRRLLDLRAALARAARQPRPDGDTPEALLARGPHVAEAHRDRLTGWLAAHRPDLALRPFVPQGAIPGIDVGWQVEIGGTTLAYLVHPNSPDLLSISQLQRQGGARALRSPLGDLVRFLRLVQASGAGIERVRSSLGPAPGAPLSFARLAVFGQRYLPARNLGLVNGLPTFEGDLTAFSWTTERAKVRQPRPRRPASPPPAPSSPATPLRTPSVAARALGSRTRI